MYASTQHSLSIFHFIVRPFLFLLSKVDPTHCHLSWVCRFFSSQLLKVSHLLLELRELLPSTSLTTLPSITAFTPTLYLVT